MMFPHEKQTRFCFIHVFKKFFIFSLSAPLADIKRRDQKTYKCRITQTNMKQNYFRCAFSEGTILEQNGSLERNKRSTKYYWHQCTLSLQSTKTGNWDKMSGFKNPMAWQWWSTLDLYLVKSTDTTGQKTNPLKEKFAVELQYCIQSEKHISI